MWRTLAVLVVVLLGGLLMNEYEARIGPWGQLLLGTATGFVISAIVPGYFYRGEPWPWRPWRSEDRNGDSAANGSPTT